MNHPDFFDQAPHIALRDPLSAFLGAFPDGVVEYGYLDAVKLAGHSCPTVAGAYLMTAKALVALYGDALPERGAIRAEFRDDAAHGVTGVIAGIVSLITGARQDDGFKGIAGRFAPTGLASTPNNSGSEAGIARSNSAYMILSPRTLGATSCRRRPLPAHRRTFAEVEADRCLAGRHCFLALL